eukprot:TRINITY_DN41268_c0_g1_i1.p1 TRINITY_DN41268_c0_g1~~TRINITY_DN41268_c0_g1_i1.p1  ORF type:complete len:213 (+),score=19.59 TRINITY_DN41268_c0_g1_i1:72-710(+)
MALGGFVLTLVATWTSSAYGARRTDEMCDVDPSEFSLNNDSEQAVTSFERWMQGFPPVDSLLEQGVVVHVSALVNATTHAPIELEVSSQCMAQVLNASKYCQDEAVWFYQCAPLFTAEDKDRSFPLGEVCLADLSTRSEFKNVRTGCCSDHPAYKGGCCEAINNNEVLMEYCVLIGPFMLLLCCCCSGFVYVTVQKKFFETSSQPAKKRAVR